MACMYLKQKVNRNLECKKDKNRIPFKDCKNCPYKDFESNNNQIRKPLQANYKQLQTTAKLKNKSNKLAKLEKNRFSLFTDDMDQCYFCKKPKDNIHEVIFGKNRINSMKYGLTLPLCNYHHRLMHSDTSLINKWHKRGQAKFIETYPDLKFEDIFRINYL